MLVNDIAKMKAEFEEKLALAIKENELNEGIDGYQLRLDKYNGVSWGVVYKSGVGFVTPTLAQVGDILTRFPMTKNSLHNKICEVPYVIRSRNSYGSREPEMSIEWISGEHEVCISLPIDDELCKEFFKISTRETTDCENSTYASIQHYDELGRRRYYSVSVFNFLKSQKRYHGGVNLLTDIDEINRIINYIKAKL
jgi:hypothetical protein